MKNDFLIPLNGLAPGKTRFEWHAGKEFFGNFGNREILDAEISVVADVEKSGQYMGADISIDGEVSVACDRCLSELRIPIHPVARISIKAQGASDGTAADEDGREIISVSPDEMELDLSQIVYDYSCLALPMQRVHDEGECDESVAGRIGRMERVQEEDSPFSSLKGLFD